MIKLQSRILRAWKVKMGQLIYFYKKMTHCQDLLKESVAIVALSRVRLCIRNKKQCFYGDGLCFCDIMTPCPCQTMELCTVCQDWFCCNNISKLGFGMLIVLTIHNFQIIMAQPGVTGQQRSQVVFKAKKVEEQSDQDAGPHVN